MTIHSLHLRKFIQIVFSDDKRRKRLLKEIIRNDSRANSDGGGDFFSPFWADVKNFIAGKVDLTESVEGRIAGNKGRARLYPVLERGFRRIWFNEIGMRNEPIRGIQNTVHGTTKLISIGAEIKVHNAIAFDPEKSASRIIYPYFPEYPPLSEVAARIGLWVMMQAFPGREFEGMRIYDLQRGKSFSAISVQLLGNERELVERQYSLILEDWKRMVEE